MICKVITFIAAFADVFLRFVFESLDPVLVVAMFAQ
jgi:hypothetical protein